ncbi:ATP-dependent RNA helicase HrpA [Stomatohabitans albus]|uniref:ATP-dependent RNA helicase HrpA n=1 Tax=Stomatohabitans albus TaxID=3110766 RepID=UPI00300C89DE
MTIQLRYPADLPITDHVEEILQLLDHHQVVVVAGETGSGKSTQLPKIAYASALARSRDRRPKLIGHTQPRRIAARAVAERVAEEMGTTIGQAVAYTVRFTDTTGPETRIKVMTDGILLNEFQRDPALNRYDTLIIDEAHERSLNIDFILGYLANLLPKRPDLRVIITSATIDTERFAEHFAHHGEPAPIVQVSGRTYPVEIRYRPLDAPSGAAHPEDDDFEGNNVDRDVTEGIVLAVHELCAEGPGDILVFTSGEGPIRDATEALSKAAAHDRLLQGVEIVPLFARLSAQEQHNVFSPHTGRRIVIATNIAETSLTVPGIRYVVDSGLARISRYGRKSKVQRLPIEAISQASANQRSGRCGRIGPGIAIRLYSEDDFHQRPAFTEPEILRTNLASVMLQMTSLGLGDVAEFPFIQPPDKKAINDAKTTLDELDAIEAAPQEPNGQRLTDIGRAMARLPVDPRLARLMIAGAAFGVLDAAIICTAALSLRDVREYPEAQRDVAVGLHRRFDDPASDYLTVLALWNYLQDQRAALSGTKFRALCKAEFIHFLRWREWVDLVNQLCKAAKDAFLVSDTANRVQDHDDARAPGEALHRAVLVAMAAGVGQKRIPTSGPPQSKTKRRRPPQKGPVTYSGTRGTQFRLGKRSATSTHPPDWVVASEIVETTGLWATHVATIDPQWIVGLLRHHCTFTRSDQRWMADRGQAVVTERISFRGLVIEPGRPVPLAHFDQGAARDLFIQEGLVGGQLTARSMTPELQRVITANQAAIDDAHELEDRMRARGIIDPEAVLIDRLMAVLPKWVTGATELTKWIRKGTRPLKRRDGESNSALKERRARAAKQREASITFRAQQLIGDADGLGGRGFPDHLTIDGHELGVTYTFDPSDAEADGMTIHVPVGVLPAITPGAGDWLVPGFRAELIETILRGLDKTIRRGLSPIATTAQRYGEQLDPADGPFNQVLATTISNQVGQIVTAAQIAQVDRPAHLRVRWAVTNNGTILATSPDLGALQAGVAGHMRAEIKKVGAELEADGLDGFPETDLPRAITRQVGGHAVTGYPALVPDTDGKHVRIRIMPTEATQRSGMVAAQRQLLLAHCARPLQVVNGTLGARDKLRLTLAPHESVEALAADMAGAVVDDLLMRTGGVAWTHADFVKRTEVIDRHWKTEIAQVARIVVSALTIAEAVNAALTTPTQHRPSLQVRANVLLRYQQLVYPGFVTGMGVSQLRELPRYLDALRLRLLALPGSFDKDDRNQLVMVDLEEDFAALKRARVATQAELNAIRWQLEELHVQLFAQRLGTAQSVSERRIRNQIRALIQRDQPA